MEIERKFLVNIEAWKRVDKPKGKEIIQAYLTNEIEKSIRIRVKDDQAFITVKGKQRGISRHEFEYEIPVSDAKEMIRLFADSTIEKLRYEIPTNQHVWEVDVFKGKLTGLVLAEIELTNENDLFDLPNWVGQEVSTDPNYLNANLIHLDKWEKVD